MDENLRYLTDLANLFRTKCVLCKRAYGEHGIRDTFTCLSDLTKIYEASARVIAKADIIEMSYHTGAWDASDLRDLGTALAEYRQIKERIDA